MLKNLVFRANFRSRTLQGAQAKTCGYHFIVEDQVVEPASDELYTRNSEAGTKITTESQIGGTNRGTLSLN